MHENAQDSSREAPCSLSFITYHMAFHIHTQESIKISEDKDLAKHADSQNAFGRDENISKTKLDVYEAGRTSGTDSRC